jgi:4-aminobutyrate aminotransferase
MRNDRPRVSPSEGDENLSPLRQAWQKSAIDRQTAELLEEDARYFLRQSLSTPCLNALRWCEGSWIEDLQGRRYLDFHGNSVHQVGYANPAVIAAVKAQLDELAFCPRRYTNAPAVELAQKLAEIAPGDLSKVLLCPGGTSAVGMALKLARIATGRHKTISMWDSFHGASLDAISIGGEALFRAGVGPLLPGCSHVPPADSYRCLWGCHERGGCDLKCEEYLEYVLEHEGDVAAVIAEPVRSTPYIPPAEYWQRVRRACDRHGALLIFDEICSGLGRTGRMFTSEHFDVVPDIVVLGKGLGGGVMPLAALIARPELDVAADRALGHYTHEKSPVAAAAALATISYIQEHSLVERAAELGDRVLGQLRKLAERHPLVGDVRGIGLLLGVELVRNRATRERATSEAEAVMYKSLERGLSFKLTMGNIIALTPPLTVTDDELDRAIRILDESLTEVERA